MDMALIKELRERTGVGFGDCKKALVEADWDMDRAVDIVRLQSGAKAAKKADRTAAEGLLGLKIDGSHAAMVEVNVETDFAAPSSPPSSSARSPGRSKTGPMDSPRHSKPSVSRSSRKSARTSTSAAPPA